MLNTIQDGNQIFMLVGTGSLKYTGLARGPQGIETFPEGAVLEIHAISGDRQLCCRLESMGLVPGKRIQVLKNRGKGLLLKTEHTRLAVRLSPAFSLQADYASP